jgi:hypothetical protein
MTMSEKKDPKPRLQTPEGFAKWAAVHEPKLPFQGDKDPRYEIEVHFDPAHPDWKKWCEEVTAHFRSLPDFLDRQGSPVKRHPPIKYELDRDGNRTGRMYATFRSGAQYAPGVFDRYARRIPKNVKIGNGSTVIVNYTPAEFGTAVGVGLNFYLNGVQVLDLKEFEPQSAEALGFKAHGTPPMPQADSDGGTGQGRPTANPPQAPEDDLPF